MNTKTIFFTLILTATSFFQAAALTYEEELALLKKEHRDTIAQLTQTTEDQLYKDGDKWVHKNVNSLPGWAIVTGTFGICLYVSLVRKQLDAYLWAPFTALAGAITIRHFLDFYAKNDLLNKRILQQDKIYQKKLDALHVQHMSFQKATV